MCVNVCGERDRKRGECNSKNEIDMKWGERGVADMKRRERARDRERGGESSRNEKENCSSEGNKRKEQGESWQKHVEV